MPPTTLAPLVAKLTARTPLDAVSRQALLDLPHTITSFAPNTFLVREGDPALQTCVLLSGFAYRQKVVADGGRQIVAVQVSGDPVDLHNSLLKVADHSVTTLTRGVAAVIPRNAIHKITRENPEIAHALWVDTLVDAAIAREWIVNIGRRDARSRLAHMFCEFAVRLKVAGIEQAETYELPMTQEQIGDTLGLTSVHVNRMIRQLEADGLIARSQRTVTILQMTKLRSVAGFDDTYLHINLMDA